MFCFISALYCFACFRIYLFFNPATYLSRFYAACIFCPLFTIYFFFLFAKARIFSVFPKTTM